MTPDAVQEATSVLDARVAVPQHVVYRSFPSETVVLNLNTGKYHGLNATAGRMLETLERSASVRAAALTLAAEYEQPAEILERDLCALCRALLQRGLVEVDGSPAS